VPQSRLALISMPWALYNRPSIQLGALKAYIEAEGEFAVDCFHPYLDVAAALGTDIYTTISDSSWAGEAVFSALLFTEKFADAEQLFNKSLGHAPGPGKKRPLFAKTVNAVAEVCDQWLAGINWSDFQLIGFSVCFNQLLASLYISQKIASLDGAPPIVFGGSSCAGKLGQSLLDNFRWLDFVVDGEGEKALVGLLHHLSDKSSPLPERIHARNRHPIPTPCPEIADLSSLPTPDFDHYYQQLQRAFPDSPFNPVLPVEFSRGCWWNKCTFCNLNLQWHTYRNKTAEKMLEELSTLCKRYQSLDFTFCDNALPVKEGRRFFATMAEVEPDLRFFAEIRGTTSLESLKGFKKGGLDTIQVGIEALSTSLLKKMDKGVTAIENLAIMKNALAAGIRLEGNLIVEFPGSTQDEVAETIDTLDYVFPFHPLAPAAFFLGHGSPVACNQEEFGITALLAHSKNKKLFPSNTLNSLTLLTSEYRGDRGKQKNRWQPVRKKIQAWQKFHKSRKQNQQPALRYRDGSSFIMIWQEVPDAPPLRHKLTGVSRQIYLFCSQIRSLDELQSQFPAIKGPTILAFIDQLCQKRLMFREQNRVLSLAIRQHN